MQPLRVIACWGIALAAYVVLPAIGSSLEQLEEFYRLKFVERATHRDQTAAVVGGEIAFGGNLATRRPATGIEGGEQVEIDLVVQRNGAELEPEPGQPKRSSSGSTVELCGLRGLRMLITL